MGDPSSTAHFLTPLAAIERVKDTIIRAEIDDTIGDDRGANKRIEAVCRSPPLYFPFFSVPGGRVHRIHFGEGRAK